MVCHGKKKRKRPNNNSNNNNNRKQTTTTETTTTTNNDNNNNDNNNSNSNNNNNNNKNNQTLIIHALFHLLNYHLTSLLSMTNPQWFWPLLHGTSMALRKDEKSTSPLPSCGSCWTPGKGDSFLGYHPFLKFHISFRGGDKCLVFGGNYNIKSILDSNHHLFYHGSSYQCHSYQDRGPHVHCLYGLLFLALLLSWLQCCILFVLLLLLFVWPLTQLTLSIIWTPYCCKYASCYCCCYYDHEIVLLLR